jgi:hypothetical protein
VTHEPYEQPCAACGKPVDVLASSTLYEAVGWAQTRKGGGLHHLRDQRRTGRVMHASCAALNSASSQQGALV